MNRSRWSIDRTRLIHDSLKNQLLPAILAAMQTAGGAVILESAASEQLAGILARWSDIEAGLCGLIARFPTEMSYTTLVSTCSTIQRDQTAYEWICHAAQTHKSDEESAEDPCGQAQVALAKAVDCFSRLRITKYDDVTELVGEVLDYQALKDAYLACQRLSETFARFPDRPEL
jgi:hypothetical protein